jgi:hypothetical protein
LHKILGRSTHVFRGAVTDKVLPDSEIVRWPKTEAIISNVISAVAIETVKAFMENIPFCRLVADAGSPFLSEIFPVFIQYFDREKG